MMDKNHKGNIENPIVTLPRYLYEEFLKNPNNPDIKRKINTYLPEDMTVEDFPELTGCSHHHYYHSHFLFILTGISKRKLDGQLFQRCNCPQHRHHPQVLTETLRPRMMDDPFTDDPTKLQQQSYMINRYERQYVTEGLNFDNRSADRDPFLQEDPTEEINQQLLDAAIAASLTSNDSVLKQFEEAPEPIPKTTMNSELISIRNPSLPSSKDTYPSPPTDTHLLSPVNRNSSIRKEVHSPSSTDTCSVPLKDTYSPQTTVTYSSPSTDIRSPPPKDERSLLPNVIHSSPQTDTSSSSPAIVNPDYIRSPTIEGKLFETLLR
jgi:hypothetical protein